MRSGNKRKHMKRLGWTVVAFCLALAPMTVATNGAKPTAPEKCVDAFQRPPFVSLNLVAYRSTRELNAALQPLIGMECTLDQLGVFLVEKGATIDRQTEEIIYTEIKAWRKLLYDSRIALPTSIIGRVVNNRIIFLNASIDFI